MPASIERGALAVAAVLAALAAAPASAATGCDATTAAAARACAFDAEADYFDALGRCANTGTGGDLDRCLADAETERTTAKADCGAQEQARGQVCAALGQAPYDPPIRPSDFTASVTNPYFPLVPGTVFTYRGPDTVTTVEVSNRKVTILGVRCLVVRDTNMVDGALEEDTFDYYAQDRDGNVWYFGEASTDYEGGAAVSTEGSWLAGVDGAKPGIIMPARPQIGTTYRQEFALSDAEDLARVENQGVRVALPGKRFGKALQTFDFTPLEPEAREQKYYVRGIGQVLTVDLVTGDRTRLVSVEKP